MNNQDNGQAFADEQALEYVEVGSCCDDCALAIANDDYTGTDDATEARVRAGLERIGHYLVLGDEQGFSRRNCDVCGALAGNRHEVGHLS